MARKVLFSCDGCGCAADPTRMMKVGIVAHMMDGDGRTQAGEVAMLPHGKDRVDLCRDCLEGFKRAVDPGNWAKPHNAVGGG